MPWHAIQKADVMSLGSGRDLQVCTDPIEQSEAGGLAEAGPGAPFDQAPGSRPLPKGRGVGQRGAVGDDGAVGLDIGARVEQRVEYGHVITTGRPVQRGLTMGSGEPGIDIRPGRDERRDCSTPRG